MKKIYYSLLFTTITVCLCVVIIFGYRFSASTHKIVGTRIPAVFSSIAFTQSNEPPQITGNEILDVLQRVNYYRHRAGLHSVTYDAQLSHDCAQHVHYMVLNNTIEHNEDAHREGYTPEGAQAAVNSNLSSGVSHMVYAVDIWMFSLFHRLPLLEPSLEHIGFAFSNQGGYACLYASDVNFTEYYSQHTAPVLFPAPGMHAVPAIWYAGEQPDPFADFDSTAYPTGTPITVSFSPYDEVKQFTIEVEDGTGVFIDGYTRLPKLENDPYKEEQRNTVSFIPRTPLQKEECYTVHATGTVNNESFTRIWSFTTAKD